MRSNIKYILIFLSFIFSSINVYAQQSVAEIELIHFNSTATYASGSGVSVHIHPKGIYQIDNQFILELSDIGGDFNGNTQTLSTVVDFYTPLMNGVIPDNTNAGSSVGMQLFFSIASVSLGKSGLIMRTVPA